MQRNVLRKREIVFALAMGALAAGGAGIVISEMQSDPVFVEAAPVERDFQSGPFTKIATVGPQEVNISFGDAISVRADGPPEAIERLEAIVEDGRLTIRPKPGFHWRQWGMLEDVTFNVTLPRLDSITLAGSGDVNVDRIESDKFEATVGGEGEITIGDLKADEANLTVNGSGNVVVTGLVRNARIHTAGEGEVQAGGLRSTTASVTVYGEGDVALIVDEEAQVSVTGDGDVTITGPGKCSVTRYGPGEVRCAGGGGIENED